MGDAKVRVAPLGRDRRDEFLDVDQWAFFFDDTGRDPDLAVSVVEWDRTFGAFVDDGGAEALAGINSTYTMDLPVPGGSIPCAGLSWVGVHPQFRRRGVLRAMIADHLSAVAAAGEPVSALHASEAGIYGRFGYGMATPQLRLTLGRGSALRDVPGHRDVRVRIDTATPERWADVVGDCYELARRERPGTVSRDTRAHRDAWLSDEAVQRRGSEPLRIMVAEAEGDGPVRGYALFRRTPKWEGALPGGRVGVRELVARDAAAARALWGRLVDLDLTGSVETDDRPLDDPLLHLLEDPRVACPTLVDGLYVRLVDLPAALAARRYPAPVDVVLEVRDDLLPANAGRWRLTGGPDGARCTRTGEAPALTLDVRELGAAYLGTVTLASLAAASLVTAADPAALHAASTAFGWPVAACCAWGF